MVAFEAMAANAKEAVNSEVIKMKNEQSVSPQRQEYLRRRGISPHHNISAHISLCGISAFMGDTHPRGVLDPFIVSSPRAA